MLHQKTAPPLEAWMVLGIRHGRNRWRDKINVEYNLKRGEFLVVSAVESYHAGCAVFMSEILGF
jgi:hypothetical protein